MTDAPSLPIDPRKAPLILRFDKQEPSQLNQAFVDAIYCAVAHALEGRAVQVMTASLFDGPKTTLVRLDVLEGQPVMGYLMSGDFDLRLPNEQGDAKPDAQA